METVTSIATTALTLIGGMALLLLVLRGVREEAQRRHEDEVAERTARRYRLGHPQARMGQWEHQHQHHGSRSLRS